MNNRYLFRSPQFALALGLLGLLALQVRACTIFVLTDTNRALFCNNEDGPNLKTRIWFVPPGPKHYGAVYVGYDNGWAQGGLNTEGLAFDWVAGYKEEWGPDPGLPTILRNEQVLETCATVEQAIAFYREHHEASFDYAKILLADRAGTSVIIGAKSGQLQVEKSDRCRGFGYGARTLDKMLAGAPEPTVANGAQILRACLQQGQYATRYFNIFDLKSGDVFLFPSPTSNHEVKLNLAAELKKGGHYYDMLQIHEQLTQPPQSLLPNMERFRLEKYKPIADQEPKVTDHVRAMLQDAINGALHAEDFTPEAWQDAASKQQETQAAIKALGRFVSLTLVDRQEEGGKHTYRYRVEFEKNSVLQRLVFDEHNKLASSDTEDIK
ncbi:conserved exported hypothetical protein [Verrucomicrobia bacterium]|nr:conserved exported hypothetical protein [Verrucomicrobiota bacterium]